MTYKIKYRREEEMKDSGIEWLGKIPKDFKLSSLKYFYEFMIGSTPSSGDDSYYSRDGYKWLTIRDIKSNLIEDTSSYVSEKAIRETNMKLNKKGSLVYSFKLSVGQVAFLGDSMYTNEAIATFSISNKNSLKFLYYMAPIFIIKNANDNIYGAKLLNQNLINNAKVLIPNLSEQQKNANFLDLKTAEFDSIISKKELLIEKLEEAKKSLISEVVTGKVKIVDGELVKREANEMKDSGVEWLGMIPKDWEVARLKKHMSITGGNAFSTTDFVDEGIQVLKIANLYQNELALDRQPTFLSDDKVKLYRSFLVSKDDILISLTGTLGKRDYGFAILLDSEEKFLLNQRVGRLRLKSNIVLKYILFVLRSEIYLSQLYSYPSGTKQANLSNDDVLKPVVTVPICITEQYLVTEYLTKMDGEINSIITKTKLQIQKLKQAKQSLISEAVTGKIDLRDWEIREI